MESPTSDGNETREQVERLDGDRYAAFQLEDEGVVIYDEQNHRAWIQSDAAVSVDAIA